MAQDIIHIGSILAERRRQLGLSQEALGARIGVDESRISEIESGKGLTLDTINKVASALESHVKVEIRPCHRPNKDKLLYTMMAISKFALAHNITRKDAAKYLVRYKGIDYLDDFYEVEHTFSFEDCIKDLTVVCHKNGGGLCPSIRECPL